MLKWKFAKGIPCQSHCVRTFCRMTQLATKNVLFFPFLFLSFSLQKIVRKKASAKQLVMCGIQTLNFRGLSPPSSTQLSNSLQKGKSRVLLLEIKGGHVSSLCLLGVLIGLLCLLRLHTIYLAGLERKPIPLEFYLTHFKYFKKKGIQQSIRILDPLLYLYYQGSVMEPGAKPDPAGVVTMKHPLMASLLMNVWLLPAWAAA